MHVDLARTWAQADGARDGDALRALDLADRIAPVRVRRATASGQQLAEQVNKIGPMTVADGSGGAPWVSRADGSVEAEDASADLGLFPGSARDPLPPDGANPEIAASRLRWRNERQWLTHHRGELAQLAAQLYPAEYQVPHAPLLAPPEWLPAQPVELGALGLRLDEGPQAVAVDGSEPESEPTRPLRTSGTRFVRYTSAIKHVSPPALFWSGPGYRLLDVVLASDRLEFGLGTFFGRLDVSEALGHELSALCLADGLPSSVEQLRGRLPFRELVGDPFDLRRRVVIPGIATLTIRLRHGSAEPSFLLHWRDPAKVVAAGGLYSVIPEGMFEPSGPGLRDRRNDFDLWRNMVREYSEELLGAPDHYGARNQPIDYERWSLFQRLQEARNGGSVGAYFLGVGLVPSTLNATILTVTVIDDDVFNEVFGSTVQFNNEGEIVAVGGGTPAEGIPFTETAVRRILETEPMAASGAACLALTWRHRHALGL